MAETIPSQPTDAARGEPSALGWLLVITGIAAAVRFYGLEQQLWYDEITTLLDSVRKPLWEIVTTYETQNQHTLYSILARISVITLGESNAALRLPAVLFGTAAVPALYWFARHITDRAEAQLAAALLAVSYHQVWFSQNARGYTMLLLWTLAATTLFLRGVRQPSRAVWLGYGAILALGMYTHLTMAFVAAGHGLVWLWMLADTGHVPEAFPEKRWLPLTGFGAAGALTLLLYAPVLPQMFTRTVGGTAASVGSQWTNPMWLVWETARGLFGAGDSAAAWIKVAAGAGIAGGILLAGLISYWKQDRALAALLVLPGVVTAAVMLALGHNLWPRFFFFAIGFAFLLVFRGLRVFADWATPRAGRHPEAGRRIGTAAALLLIGVSTWTMPPAFLYPKQDFAGAMDFVERVNIQNQRVLTAGLATLPYVRYYQRDWPAAETAAQLREFRANGTTGWVVYSMPIFIRSRQPEIWNAIESEFTTVRIFRGTLGSGEVYVARTKP